MTPAYTLIQIALHWVIALLVLVNWFLGDAMGDLYREALRSGSETGYPTPHTVIGMLVIVLTIVRLVIKLRRGAPPPLPGTEPQMHLAANLGHMTLYALLLAVPLTGVLAWGVGIEAMGGAHEVASKLLMVMALGHAGMALYHHFGRKDDTLRRMTRPM